MPHDGEPAWSPKETVNFPDCRHVHHQYEMGMALLPEVFSAKKGLLVVGEMPPSSAHRQILANYLKCSIGLFLPMRHRICAF